MEKVRFGLLGCGGMGRALADQAVTLDQAAVTAVTDVDAGRAAEAAERYGAVALGQAELLASDTVDAVIVASPGGYHRAAIEAVAAAGKHVFSEKPLTSYSADADACIAAVKAAGVKGMVGQVCRFHPTHLKLKTMVDDGTIGPVFSIYVERVGGGWGDKIQPWRLSRDLSGGSLLEINAHELDFMLWLAGRVKRVSAAGGNYCDSRLDYPDMAWVALTFESGACGVLQSSHITTLGSYAARIDGQHASAVIPQLFGGPITLKPRDGETVTVEPEPVETPVKAEIRAFVEAIVNDTEPPVPFEQARHTVAVAEAASTSIATGKTVEL
ncbi:MAG: Gfo/Idh/MocA family oxidoreductase [Armatimonadetes bacterium]|nr:Gfo/Idh/MocA family oxidoreductase [Armatimonadota bacterium]